MALPLTATSHLQGSDVAFELPIPGLFVDLEVGSASVCLTNEFLEAPARIKVDVLEQWMEALVKQREAALVQLFRDFARDNPQLTIVQQIDRFRTRCTHQGITCPADLAILLQRY
jgi:hypothetical protein